MQLEYSSFGNLNYTHTSADGSAYVQVIPWFRSSRVVYAGDLANDVLALDFSTDDCAPARAAVSARRALIKTGSATSFGLRTAYGSRSRQPLVQSRHRSVGGELHQRRDDRHGRRRRRSSTTSRSTARPTAPTSQDKWTPSAAFSLQAGLRYD